MAASISPQAAANASSTKATCWRVSARAPALRSAFFSAAGTQPRLSVARAAPNRADACPRCAAIAISIEAPSTLLLCLGGSFDADDSRESSQHKQQEPHGRSPNVAQEADINARELAANTRAELALRRYGPAKVRRDSARTWLRRQHRDGAHIDRYRITASSDDSSTVCVLLLLTFRDWPRAQWQDLNRPAAWKQ